MYLCAAPDRMYPFGSMYGDSVVTFDDKDDGYTQFSMNHQFSFGATSYDSIYVSDTFDS
jgi:hypothetical protein